MAQTITHLEYEGRPPVEQFMRSRGTHTYRDYEQAGMTITYHDGEPVTKEEPAVAWNGYPASWDRPVENFVDQSLLDFRTRRGSGGNWADRMDEVRAQQELVTMHHSSDYYDFTVWCPECGGTILEGTNTVFCDTCEYTTEF